MENLKTKQNTLTPSKLLRTELQQIRWVTTHTTQEVIMQATQVMSIMVEQLLLALMGLLDRNAHMKIHIKAGHSMALITMNVLDRQIFTLCRMKLLKH